MPHDRAAAVQAARFLLHTASLTPRVGLITGTGLGDSLGEMTSLYAVPYEDIPHFPRTTSQGHDGRALVGLWRGCPVIVFQGRFHLFEGYDPLAVSFPVRVLQAMGIEIMILTNAAGGLNPRFSTGGIMVIRDHLNLTGRNPLVGPNDDVWGPRFPDMSRAWSPELSAVAAAGPVALWQGTYVGLAGPSLETPAEVRYLRTIGADAVGFSTVMEALAAVHAGMQLLGLSVITNVHDPDHPRSTSVEDVITAANRAQPTLAAVIGHVVSSIAQSA